MPKTFSKEPKIVPVDQCSQSRGLQRSQIFWVLKPGQLPRVKGLFLATSRLRRQINSTPKRFCILCSNLTSCKTILFRPTNVWMPLASSIMSLNAWDNAICIPVRSLSWSPISIGPSPYHFIVQGNGNGNLCTSPTLINPVALGQNASSDKIGFSMWNLRSSDR